MKFVKFLLEVGGRIVIPQVPAPPNEVCDGRRRLMKALD